MRILASNPDTIGDVVLRQPMYRALTEAGHELMLIVRPLVEPLIGSIAPGARVVEAPTRAYHGEARPDDKDFDEVAARAREFDPDLLLVAPFQWTALEERLASELDRAKVVAMTGRLYGDPRFGPAPAPGLRATIAVDAAEDAPELRKNELLTGAVLGRAMKLGDPKLEARAEHLRSAEIELRRLGLEPGSYWIACVGSSRHTTVRNWRPERWGELLAEWSRRHKRWFLLVGNAAEAESMAAVRRAMGDREGAAVEWAGSGDGALEVLVGLTALSRGYVGRDTGPMHLAAALGRPVLAVFGGGTWPRFLPAVDPSISLTVGVPCAGCGWICHLPESYCIKDVPVDAALSAVEDLESGRVKARTTRLLQADAVLLNRIGREGALSARERFAQLSVARRELNWRESDLTEKNGSVASSVDASLTAAVDGGAAASGHSRPWAGLGETGAGRLREDLAQARQRVAQLEALLAEQTSARHQQSAALMVAREQVVETRARASAMEKRLEERVAELMTLRTELGAAREQLKQEGSTRQQLEQARAAAARGAEEKAALQSEINALKQQVQEKTREVAASAAAVKQAEARLRQREEVSAAEHRQKEAQLRERISDLVGELSRVQGLAGDLRLRLERLEGDRGVVTKLTRQQEAEIVVLRGRLNDLLASRWRKLGQRIGVAMTLPWEKDGTGRG